MNNRKIVTLAIMALIFSLFLIGCEKMPRIPEIPEILPKQEPLQFDCPQIKVQMDERTSPEPTIAGKTYDGWVVKGLAHCRRGEQEGENLNYYYCGGIMMTFGFKTVDAYAEKTIISETGLIGKTTKHIIWNIYDENKNFVETKCLGNPDEFEKKQAEALEKEMLKWN